MKKKYFYDCEFNDTGTVIELISIGMVCEDGRQLYRVSNEFNTVAAANKLWLKENVLTPVLREFYPQRSLDMSHLQFKLCLNYLVNCRGNIIDTASLFIRSLDNIAADILAFIGDDVPEFWAYCGAFDHVLLVQLLKGFDNMPKHYPYFTHDLAQMIDSDGISKSALPNTNPNIHHALSDAVWCKDSYEWVVEKANKNYGVLRMNI